jgi:NDP-sugar pyrophosphorylase family protein
MRFDVSMGIYVYDPEVLEVIPEGRFDFPDVVNKMLEDGRKIAVYTGPGVWFDIGTVGEHERASAEIEAHPELFEDA